MKDLNANLRLENRNLRTLKTALRVSRNFNKYLYKSNNNNLKLY